MATLFDRLRAGRQPERYSLDEFASDVSTFVYNGGLYGPGQIVTTYGEKTTEQIEADFVGMVRSAYKRNGVVFSCQVARLSVFAQATFCWQRLRGTGPADTFTDANLLPLQEPWVNGTQGELLAKMIQDVDNGGNAYIRKRPPTSLSKNNLERLRPDWVDIVLAGDDQMMNLVPIGYLYWPGGKRGNVEPEGLMLDEVAHWSPYPDPLATYRGMSPMTPIVREIMADNRATQHKGDFFDHAATPNMAIKFDPSVTVDKYRQFKAAMEQEHSGVGNAWKTLYLGGGSEPVPVGNSFRDMDYKAVQGLGETRIASAFGVPAVIAQISEGLGGSSLNAGNFSAARRLFADKTLRWLWQEACASLQRIVTVPGGTRLWWDEKQIPFLREDQKDAAEIQTSQATTINTLVTAGFTPESAVQAVVQNDMTLLVHTGLVSVQLIPPGNATEPGDGKPQPTQPTGGKPAPTKPGK